MESAGVGSNYRITILRRSMASAAGVLNSYLTPTGEPALQQGKITVPQCESSKIWLSVYF